MNPRPSYHKYGWLAEFCGNIGRHRANTIETARLAVAARGHLFDMAEAEDISFDLERRGILHLYRDRASFDAASKANALLIEGGVKRFAVTPAEMTAIEPTLHGTFFGGFYTPDDATGDIHKFTCGLAAACKRRGVDFQFDTSVDHVRADADGFAFDLSRHDGQDRPATLQADAVLVCAGVASRRFAAMLGDRVNIYPVKGYSVTVCLDDAVSQDAAPTVSLLDEDAKIVTSRLGRNRFRVAGTAEFNGENRDIRADRVRPLVDWAARLFPAMSTETVVPWAGLRPMTPSMLPRVGRGKRPGVFYNTGHGHLGWTLSAATAGLAASAIDDQLRAPG
jgi:D-amino-acid dehydrogenase